MENEISREDLKRQLDIIGEKVGLMYYALMGNDLTKDGGLIRRIDDIEEDILLHEKKFEAVFDGIKNNNDKIDKKNFYVNLLWGGLALVIGILIEKFLKAI